MFLLLKSLRGYWGLFAIFMCLPQAAMSVGDSLSDLDLEALMDLEVTSVSKRVQSLSDTPAAVYVISSQEIKRSGATSVPDALRLAPGVEVGRLNSSTWAITIRGLNSMYSHHLLVLVDGRSVYSPFYGGVYWDMVMPMLEDIDQIEVIRGPGASLWGVNAVNGVINIITKNPELTQGTRVVAAAGNQENHFRMRSGGKHENLYYRGYAVYRDVDDSVSRDTHNSANDEMEGAQAGGRVDWLNGKERFSFQSDLSSMDKSYNHGVSPIVGEVGERFDNIAFNISGRWNKPVKSGDFQLQLHGAHTKRDEPGYVYQENAYDVDFQYNFNWVKGNRVTWGFNYRYLVDEIEGTAIFNLPGNPKDSWDMYSAFIQDEYQLTDNLTTIAGLKVEKLEGMETAWLPTLRFNYRQSQNVSYWGSISKAVRSPTLQERYTEFSNAYPEYLLDDAIAFLRGELIGGVNFDDLGGLNWNDILPLLPLLGESPSEQLVIIGKAVGNESLKAEETVSYELGWRWQPANNVFFDVASYYSRYSNLRSLELVGAEVIPNGVVATFQPINLAKGDSYGLEFATEYRPTDDVRFKFHYSHLKFIVEGDNGLNAAEFFEGASPANQFSFRTFWDISDKYAFDFDLYYVDEIVSGGDTPPDYADLNLRWAWQTTPQLNLSFVLLNLFHEERYEYQETLIGPARTEIKRSIYLQLDWKH